VEKVLDRIAWLPYQRITAIKRLETKAMTMNRHQKRRLAAKRARIAILSAMIAKGRR
jgi:hypothetical protein